VAALVFDADALIALDRGDRAIGALLATAAQDGTEAVTSSACVAHTIEEEMSDTFRGFAVTPSGASRGLSSATCLPSPSRGAPCRGSSA
jgi:hypothetical protein